MKLDYKIIWVEDKIDTKPFQSLKKKIKNHLENEFFNVTIDTAEDYKEFKAKYEETDTFDLIITDLNLNESHGSEVIDFVRDEKHILTEIFFYSANSELSSTQLANNSRITFYQLDGQDYHKELQKSIIQLIDLTISKFHHIVTMRGMIMHETSDLDVSIQEILKLIIENGDSEAILNVIKKKKIKSTNEFLKKKIDQSQDLDDFLQNIGADHRLRGLIRNIPKDEIQNKLAKYKSEIIDVRNQFAHASLDLENNTFKTKDGKEFNQALCKKIRKDINEHILNINALRDKLATTI